MYIQTSSYSSYVRTYICKFNLISCVYNVLDFYLCICVLIGGPPDDVNNVNISLDTPIACSILVQWSKASSDPVCGSVWYTVTISTEGGILIITDNTTMTSYSVTGLNYNTVYHVNVTASNNAGSSDSTSTSAMTNSIGKIIILCEFTIMYSYTYIATYVYVTYVCVTYNYESACRTFMYVSYPPHTYTYMSKYLLASCIHILLAYN